MASSGLQQLWVAFWVLLPEAIMASLWNTLFVAFTFLGRTHVFLVSSVPLASNESQVWPSQLYPQSTHKFYAGIWPCYTTIWPWEPVLEPWCKPPLPHKLYILHAYKTSTMQIIKTCAASSRCGRVPWRYHLLRHSSFKWICIYSPQTMVSRVPQVTILNVVGQNGSLTLMISISLEFYPYYLHIPCLFCLHCNYVKTPSLNKLYIFHNFTFFKKLLAIHSFWKRENRFSSMEWLWVYQPHPRAGTMLKDSWTTQSRCLVWVGREGGKDLERMWGEERIWQKYIVWNSHRINKNKKGSTSVYWFCDIWSSSLQDHLETSKKNCFLMRKFLASLAFLYYSCFH